MPEPVVGWVNRSGLRALAADYWSLHDVAMAFFLQYSTSVTVGHITVEGPDFSTILSSAQAAVQGLGCRCAALLYSPDPVPAFGKGRLLAAYTSTAGWITAEEWPE